MSGAGFIGVIDASHKNYGDEINWTSTKLKFIPMRIDFRIRHSESYLLAVGLSRDKEISQKLVMLDRLVASALLCFANIVSHERWNEQWVNPNILGWRAAYIFGKKIKHRRKAVTFVVGQWRGKGDIDSYPRTISSFELFLRRFGLCAHFLPLAACYAGIPGDSDEGRNVENKHIRFPPLVPTLWFLLGIATLGWRWWTVRFSDTDSSPRIIAGIICTVIGAVASTHRISGLTE